jgi:hypothetical protein
MPSRKNAADEAQTPEDTKSQSRSYSPIQLMWLIFIGFAASLAYGLASAALVYAVDGEAEAKRFLVLYIGPFNVLVVFGLAIGTGLIIGTSQRLIPDTIEAAFRGQPLGGEYEDNKRRYFSLRRTLTFATEFTIIGFVTLHFCHFPLSGLGEALMMIAVCAQFALASYGGRKIRYAGMMLHSLLDVPVKRNLFRGRELDIINTYVNTISTLTVIGLYIGVRSYYNAPFLYDSFIGRSAQVFLLLPAILATPVLLIFNFFPREVMRRIYDKSIDVEVEEMRKDVESEQLSAFGKKLRLLELAKMQREELRYSLQLTLSDLPIGFTILIMVLEPLIKR